MYPGCARKPVRKCHDFDSNHRFFRIVHFKGGDKLSPPFIIPPHQYETAAEAFCRTDHDIHAFHSLRLSRNTKSYLNIDESDILRYILYNIVQYMEANYARAKPAPAGRPGSPPGR